MAVGEWPLPLPPHVEMVEVGPRDGLQIIRKVIPTADKIRLVQALAEAGLSRIEVTSFVHPKLVPQLADAPGVVAGLKRDGWTCMAMVPNREGAQRALDAGVDMLDVVISASETHNRRNVNQSVDESLGALEAIFGLAADVPVRCSIATAFGCPFEGQVSPQRVLRIARVLQGFGVQEIALCDTTGMTDPTAAYRTLASCLAQLPGLRWAAHFHNTRGAGAANVLAAMAAGVTTFDASVGGMGGCPFAPGATGNVATEDVVHMIHAMGVETGIDLEKLIRAAHLAEELTGEVLPGQVMRAGRSCDLHT